MIRTLALLAGLLVSCASAAQAQANPPLGDVCQEIERHFARLRADARKGMICSTFGRCEPFVKPETLALFEKAALRCRHAAVAGTLGAADRAIPHRLVRRSPQGEEPKRKLVFRPGRS